MDDDPTLVAGRSLRVATTPTAGAPRRRRTARPVAVRPFADVASRAS